MLYKLSLFTSLFCLGALAIDFDRECYRLADARRKRDAASQEMQRQYQQFVRDQRLIEDVLRSGNIAEILKPPGLVETYFDGEVPTLSAMVRIRDLLDERAVIEFGKLNDLEDSPKDNSTAVRLYKKTITPLLETLKSRPLPRWVREYIDTIPGRAGAIGFYEAADIVTYLKKVDELYPAAEQPVVQPSAPTSQGK